MSSGFTSTGGAGLASAGSPTSQRIDAHRLGDVLELRRTEIADQGESLVVETFPVFGQSSAAAEPSEGAFDDPALGQCDEACGLIRSLDDLDIDAHQIRFTALWNSGPW